MLRNFPRGCLRAADEERQALVDRGATSAPDRDERPTTRARRIAEPLDTSGTSLRDEPGVGAITAATLLREVGNPFRFACESKFALVRRRRGHAVIRRRHDEPVHSTTRPIVRRSYLAAVACESASR
jgi:transposase